MPLILVVEDSPVELMTVRRMLEGGGFRTVGAGDGRSGIELALTAEPDLILLDALLPDIDGFDVCARLQSEPRTRFIPVVMVTGLDDVESIDRAYEVGAIDFYPKPINRSLLVHRLRYLLRASHITEELRHSRHSLASAHQVARLGHWEYDYDRQRFTFSDELVQLYGLPRRADGASYEPLLAVCHPADREPLRQTLEGMLDGQQNARIEHRLADGQGGERVMEMHLAKVTDQEGGRLLMGTCIDITERKESERNMLRLAWLDRLTGLPSRSMLEMAMDTAIPAAHQQGMHVVLMAVDVDLFSRVNNALGQEAGNDVLCKVGARLAQAASAYPSHELLLERLSLTSSLDIPPEHGLVARLGADVFGVMMRVPAGALAADQPDRMAERLQRQFVAPFTLDKGQELFLTASIGVTRSQSGSTSAQTMLQQADIALREAKRRGQNEVRGYHRLMEQQVTTQLRLQSDLRRAMRRGEFQLYFQPKVAVRGGSVTGFEALLRWSHPTRGMVSPVEFISVAEETGQIVELGRWVLSTACSQFREWLEAGLVEGQVAVNVSARQFREPGLCDMVRQVLAESRLDPRHLELEITEGVLMSELRAADVVEELRSAGVSVALDDFGTGFSSLSYLTRFPIDTLKIDRCFVSGITHRSEQAAIVTAVTTLSHQLRLKVVAEGVETESELQVISDLNCDEVQGFLACEPLPAGAVCKWLRSRPQPRTAHRLL